MRTVRNFQVKKARTRNMKNPGVASTAGVSVKTEDAVGGIKHPEGRI